MINLYFLIPAVNAKIFYPTSGLALPTGTPSNEAKAKIETKPLRAETKI